MTRSSSIGQRLDWAIEPRYRELLETLPWDVPIEEWRSHGVRHLEIKRGTGRHPLVFVEIRGTAIAVKELGADVAEREIANYRRMLEMGIHTLVPLGTVVRHDQPIMVDTPAGPMYERSLTGHTVTLVVDRVVPDSLLYRRDFQEKNRRRIWDAIVGLFVELHLNGVYWGDASLANTLVKFLKESVPLLGSRTVLKAYLADAETVEIHPSLSDAKRRSDIEYFLESMQWLEEDLRASGVSRDRLVSSEHRRYLREAYQGLFEAGLRSKGFEERTGLSLRSLLGSVRRADYLDALTRHIDEHKWYLSEQRGEEVEMSEAAADWHRTVFLPVTQLFREEGMLEVIPGHSAAELYVEVMVNKYYLSMQQSRDVGMVAATRDFIQRFGTTPAAVSLLARLTAGLLRILGMREHRLFVASLP